MAGSNARWTICAGHAARRPPPFSAHRITLWVGISSLRMGPGSGMRSARSRLCPNRGLLCSAQAASVVFCAMPNGLGGKGSHTHCDKLSIIFRLGGDEVFCDSGSRCYTRSAELRNLDRSTMAHNTLAIDGADQNTLGDRSFFDPATKRRSLLSPSRGGGRASIALWVFEDLASCIRERSN